MPYCLQTVTLVPVPASLQPEGSSGCIFGETLGQSLEVRDGQGPVLVATIMTVVVTEFTMKTNKLPFGVQLLGQG